MKYLLLIYDDKQMLDSLPASETEAMMRECFAHTDSLRVSGRLLQSQALESGETATSVRIRSGRVRITDGPFTDTRELLGGFNLIEARDLDEAIQIAKKFPWARTGCIEIRPLRDMANMRPPAILPREVESAGAGS